MPALCLQLAPSFLSPSDACQCYCHHKTMTDTQSAWSGLHNQFVRAAPPLLLVSSPLAYLLLETEVSSLIVANKLLISKASSSHAHDNPFHSRHWGGTAIWADPESAGKGALSLKTAFYPHPEGLICLPKSSSHPLSLTPTSVFTTA